MFMSRKLMPVAKRNISTFFKEASALKVFQESCYKNVDFRISEESDVKEAVARFTVFTPFLI